MPQIGSAAVWDTGRRHKPHALVLAAHYTTAKFGKLISQKIDLDQSCRMARCIGIREASNAYLGGFGDFDDEHSPSRRASPGSDI